MTYQKFLKSTHILFSILTVIFFTGSLVILIKSYHDPRWRIFDYNSRQATEGEIYNVAEIHAVKAVRLTGKRTLAFTFTPTIKTQMWTVRAQKENRPVHRGKRPEIPFPDEPYTDTFEFIPDGVKLARDIKITISFYPKERYEENGLSWPDNYYSPYSSIPFSIITPHSIDEWAEIPDNDPEIIEARDIMGNSINMNVPVKERSEQVFRFIMDKIKISGGVPTDEMQEASPLETYEMLSSGSGKGWCENRALVYYLFANAAGVKTRLVDIAGKFGPLKLTGHYFCESWDPDKSCWYLVDPQSSVAHVKTSKGKLLNTLEIKRLFDVDELDNCTVLAYDRASGSLVNRNIENYYKGNKGYFNGEIVLAYKFSYPRNKTYSKLKNFFCYPTLLYAPFALPKLYVIKIICLVGCMVSLVITLTLFIILTAHKKTRAVE